MNAPESSDGSELRQGRPPDRPPLSLAGHLSVGRQVRILVALLEICYPGAAERGRKVASLARQLAERFEMPAKFRRELEVVARIYDLGRLASHIAEDLDARNADDRDARTASGLDAPERKWQHAVNLRAVLRRAGEFESAADLAGSIYENWDGTGMPGHLAAGQIPLRSRILRVVLDFVETSEASAQPAEEILAELAEHSGTRYDPMAIVHLLQISLADVSSIPQASSMLRVPVHELKVGMVLAQDLHTDAGLKLLARDTVLTRGTLDAVLRRHRFDPIVGGVLVRRGG